MKKFLFLFAAISMMASASAQKGGKKAEPATTKPSTDVVKKDYSNSLDSLLGKAEVMFKTNFRSVIQLYVGNAKHNDTIVLIKNDMPKVPVVKDGKLTLVDKRIYICPETQITFSRIDENGTLWGAVKLDTTLYPGSDTIEIPFRADKGANNAFVLSNYVSTRGGLTPTATTGVGASARFDYRDDTYQIERGASSVPARVVVDQQLDIIMALPKLVGTSPVASTSTPSPAKREYDVFKLDGK